MSSSDGLPRGRYELPVFDLECRFDDPFDPDDVTIFDPEPADNTSAWISADILHSIPIDQIA